MGDYLEIARRIFEGTRYKSSDEDIIKLADNRILLEKRGLDKLNKRLVDARKHTKIFETIAVEADNKEDIDICDALFGTEYEIIDRDKQSWSREGDGLFSKPDFSKKVAGVIAIKRKREQVEEISSLSPEEVVSRLSPKKRKYLMV